MTARVSLTAATSFPKGGVSGGKWTADMKDSIDLIVTWVDAGN
jgi:hypothetical protein